MKYSNKILLTLILATTLSTTAFGMKRGHCDFDGNSPKNKKYRCDQPEIKFSTLQQLPEHLMLEVLSKLSLNEILKASSTCHKARACLPKALSNFINQNPENHSDLILVLKIFKNLVQNGQAFSEATNIAISNINNPNLPGDNALEVLDVLFKKGQAIQEATAYAIDKINDTNVDYSIKLNALAIFIILIQNNQSFKEAADSALEIFFNPSVSWWILAASAELIETLVNKNKAIQEIITAIKANINSSDKTKQDQAYELKTMLETFKITIE